MGNILAYGLNTVRQRLTKLVSAGMIFTIVNVLLHYYKAEPTPARKCFPIFSLYWDAATCI